VTPRFIFGPHLRKPSPWMHAQVKVVTLIVTRTMQLGKTKVIKHKGGGGVAAYFHSHLNLNLSQWKEGIHNSYLLLRVNKGATLDLFVCMVYVTLVGFEHKSESLFQNLAVDI